MEATEKKEEQKFHTLPEVAELMTVTEIPDFDPEIASDKTLDEMEHAHEIKYVDQFLAMEEEKRLVEVNCKDFSEFEEATQKKALKIADNIETDPNWLSKNGDQINSETQKPVEIIRTVYAKRKEVQQLGWKVEYQKRLIERIRNLRKGK